VRRIVTTLGVVLVFVGCSDTRSPVTPTPLPIPTATPSTPVPLQPIRGIVYEVTAQGRHPLVGVGLDISVEYQSWPPVVFSGQDGRFTSQAANSPSLKIAATKATYSQPCRVQASGVDADHEIYLVSNDLLSTTGLPASYPISSPVLTGRIFERTPIGDQSIAGAAITLDFTGGMGWAPSATTVSDANGRYLLCNVENATGLGLSALVSKTGYVDSFVDVGLNAPPTFDVMLTRR
jgi:hypothetical protein